MPAMIERPPYLDLAPGAAPQAVRVVGAAARPFAMAAGIAVLGAVAGYFVPRVLDDLMARRESQTYDLETDG